MGDHHRLVQRILALLFQLRDQFIVGCSPYRSGLGSSRYVAEAGFID